MQIELRDGPFAGRSVPLPDYVSPGHPVSFATETKLIEYASTGARNKETGAMIYSATSIADRVSSVAPKQRKPRTRKPPAAEFSA